MWFLPTHVPDEAEAQPARPSVPYAVQALDELPEPSPLPACVVCADPNIGPRAACAVCRALLRGVAA